MTSTAFAPATTAPMHRTDYAHTSANGFCTVCGSVWPCATASRTAVLATVTAPVAR